MSKTRVGLIGAGYWGPNLARNFVQIEDAEFVAVADLNQKSLDKIKSLYPDVQTTRVYQDLFRMNLDAVVIATPPITHYTFAKECLEHGLHVMVEKPLVLNSRTGEHLIEVARQHNRVLMVGHTFEYNPAVRAIKKFIDSGELGEIYYIDAVRANLGLFQPNVNAMWDLAPHDISIILYLLGQYPESVSCDGGQFVMKKVNVHDVVYMHMHFADGVRANIRVSWLDPNKTRTITVVGSKKMLVYDDVSPSEKIKIYDKGVSELHWQDSFNCDYRYGDILTPHIEWKEPLRVECQHFIDCIRTGQQPLSDGESGLRVVRVLEAAEQSLQSRHGGHVFVEDSAVYHTNHAVGD
jgi:predicted dehydrogenase